MKKNLFIGVLTTLFFVQCGKKNDPFIIQKGAIGDLTKQIQMKQVDSIFANDSIIKLNPIIDVIGTQGEVEVYEKGGAKLLLLSPQDENDPNSTITTVQIFDNRYKTEKGLHKGSTFKDVKTNYTIASIQTTINSIVVSLEETDVYLIIDKQQLPENLRYNLNAKIESSQIPDDASFKYFMVSWEKASD